MCNVNQSLQVEVDAPPLVRTSPATTKRLRVFLLLLLNPAFL
jgi:hypothetical protein